MPADQNPTLDDVHCGVLRRDISEIATTTKRHPHCTVLAWHMRSVSRTSKSMLICLVATFALLASSRAHGQGTGGTLVSGTGGVTGASGALAASDFTIKYEYYDGKQWVQMNDTQQKYFFNRARCECVADSTNWTGYVKIAILPDTNTGQKIQQLLTASGFAFGVGKLYAGNNNVNCLNPNYFSGGVSGACTNLLDPNDFTASFPLTVFESQRLYETPPIAVATLFNSLAIPTCGSNGTCSVVTACDSPLVTQTIYFWAQTAPGNVPDAQAFTSSVSLDGALSFEPFNVSAEGGNEALVVNWGWQTGLTPSGDPNFLGVQIFCQRGQDNYVFPSGSYGPTYMTSANVCKDVAPANDSPGQFSNYDPIYLCSGLLPSTATSYRIKGLQNGIPYGVGVAAIDRYYNVSAISEIAYATPIPTVDFYSDYKSSGGAAQGGFCALSGRHSRPGLAALLFLAGLSLALGLRRLSKRRPPGAGTFAILVVAGTLSAGQARAQPLYHDSSFVQDSASEAWGGSEREFAIEARFGLYLPDVDSAFGGDAGTKPQAFIFGNKRRPMWQLEFDWEFLKEFGTLALGGVIGYYKENALSCKQVELLADPSTCVRSGDNTSLRLIPLAALLVYRLDEGAARWHIPLVPYAKIGLNYTIWTVTNGNGDVPYSSGGKGQGGTMGWQAALGISLRLDFLDPGAARGFDADSGVNHTYAFFEFDHIDGSGLYRKDVLRVGDNTWFAGLMFEF